LIKSFIGNWKFYCSQFVVKAGNNQVNEEFKSQISQILNADQYNSKTSSNISIEFPTTGQKIASFSMEDHRSLSEIEKIKEYTVSSLGITSQFKFGGYVISESNGHGLVVAVCDMLEKYNLPTAIKKSKLFSLFGYNDWHVPSSSEFQSILGNLFYKGFGGFDNTGEGYWSSDGLKFFINDDYHTTQQSDCPSCPNAQYFLRLVREF